MRSTLACEASSATKAFDRGAYVRTMLYEIEKGWRHHWESVHADEKRNDWTEMCKTFPFCLGTDCKSLYDVCMKSGSILIREE